MLSKNGLPRYHSDVETRPDLRRLEVFHEVARAGGVTRAAKSLRVGQPSISKSIRALEEELGVVLFERHKRGMTLTGAGERVRELATRIFEDVSRIASFADEERGILRGDVVIASNEHVASYLLPDVVASLRTAHPALVPRLFTGPASLLVREIVEGRCELGLFFKVEKDPRIERIVLARVPCQLVVARGKAKDARVLESFIGSREIDDVGNKAFPTLDFLKRARPRTKITISSNSLESHKALVLRGCGVSVLPLFVVEEELRERTLEVIHPEWTYPAALELVTRRGKILSRAAHAVLKALRQRLLTRRALPARERPPPTAR